MVFDCRWPAASLRLTLGMILVLVFSACRTPGPPAPAALVPTPDRELGETQLEAALPELPTPLPLEPPLRPSPTVERLHRALLDHGQRLSPEDRARIIAVLVHAEERDGLDGLLVLALIAHESRFDPGARGPNGSLGLMQVRPFVGEDVARAVGIPWQGSSTLLDPVANVRIGTSYLQRMIEMFGEEEMALAAYNMGPSRVRRWLRRGRVPRPAYVGKVIDEYQTLLREAESIPLPELAEPLPASSEP